MRFLKNNFKLIIGFIIGVILTSGITVYAYSYFAKDISYTKPGEAIPISVETALNDLYNRTHPVLLWTNNSPTSAFNPKTISLNLASYNYVLIISRTNTSTDSTPRGTSLIRVSDIIPENQVSISACASRYTRSCYATTTGITFDNAYWGNEMHNDRIIPLFIYGIKFDMDINSSLGY